MRKASNFLKFQAWSIWPRLVQSAPQRLAVPFCLGEDANAAFIHPLAPNGAFHVALSVHPDFQHQASNGQSTRTRQLQLICQAHPSHKNKLTTAGCLDQPEKMYSTCARSRGSQGFPQVQQTHMQLLLFWAVRIRQGESRWCGRKA